MPNLVRFSKTKLADWRQKGSESLFFFQRAILQDRDLDPDIHAELCGLLQGLPEYGGPWRRLLISGFRGSLKSSAIRAWATWKGLYVPNWSLILVMQRDENAEAMHTKLQEKFRFGPSAGLLQAMFADRLEGVMGGWTTQKTEFRRTDPNADIFLMHAGLDSRLESKHKDAVWGDDLEGADADRSDAPNAESRKFVEERAEPLLREPGTGQVVISGTPHGRRPLVWYLKRMADDQQEKAPEDPLRWRYWWKEVCDSEGRSRWAARFPDVWISSKQKQGASSSARRMWDMQYMLRERSGGSTLFNIALIREQCYELLHGRILRYYTHNFNERLYDPDTGIPSPERSPAYIDLAYCRFFIHWDPKHLNPEDHVQHREKPSKAAIVVTAVSPDFHIFVMDAWIEEEGLDVQVEKFLYCYRRYEPLEWTFEATGAQRWLENYLRQLEQTKYREMLSLPAPWKAVRGEPGRYQRKRLSKPTTRIRPISTTTQGKEQRIIEALEIEHNLGFLHLHPSQEELLFQHEQFPSSEHAMDGLDALAQGPTVWSPPISPKQKAIMLRKREAQREARMVEPITGYVRSFDPAYGPN